MVRIKVGDDQITSPHPNPLLQGEGNYSSSSKAGGILEFFIKKYGILRKKPQKK